MAKTATQLAKPNGGGGNGAVVAAGGSLAEMFEADAGSGFEGTTQESYAIPFLSVLQKGSPQVDESSGVAIEGAKAGMLFENVTGRMYDGKEGVLIVPCAQRRVFLRWRPRGVDGAGFRGELRPEDVAEMRQKRLVVEVESRLYVPGPDGQVNEKRCDRISDTRNHYCLLLDPDKGTFTRALVSLTSTQIKKSRLLMSMLDSVRIQTADGRSFKPPTYANLVRITTVPESNDQGTWHGVKFELAGQLSAAQRDVYLEAKEFHDAIQQGMQVDVKYEGEPTPAAAGGGDRLAEDDIPF